jgi:hypothetical protein
VRQGVEKGLCKKALLPTGLNLLTEWALVVKIWLLEASQNQHFFVPGINKCMNLYDSKHLKE